jgi:tetratricopeptide (TPR) repeat protein
MLLFYIDARRLSIIGILFLMFALALPAQTFGSRNSAPWSGGDISVRGTVLGAGVGSNLLVELESFGGSGIAVRSEVGSQGAFNLPAVRTGQYQLKLTDMHGNVIHREFIDVNRSSGPIVVQLPERQVERPVSGTISLKRLQHKVPKDARREFERAEKASRKGETEKSLKHLAKAVEQDPDYFEAQVNYGARLLQSGSPEEALNAFEKAIAIDPQASIPHTNAAAALLMLKRAEEAEKAARRAIELDPLSARGQYVFGVSLLQQNKDSAEAIKALERASEQVPAARLALAQCYAQMGQLDQAKGELQGYLALDSTEHRKVAQSMLMQLKAASNSN